MPITIQEAKDVPAHCLTKQTSTAQVTQGVQEKERRPGIFPNSRPRASPGLKVWDVPQLGLWPRSTKTSGPKDPHTWQPTSHVTLHQPWCQ
ncbi:UNVERIFIED_CONTAM: hypothetical protein Sradi_6816600 [Sesamum radiatum]|uniref:Uncharacterized protein n=1 Tax=Sesamum radiatum TaxID=300843 RepID=A0AAW2JT51_SESRA